MKKILVYFCTCVLMLGLAACSRGGQDKDTGNSSQGSTEESSTVGTDAEDAGIQDGSDSSADDGIDSSESGEAATGNTVNGHNYEEGWTEEMAAVRSAVVDALGENYWPDAPMMPDMLEMVVGVGPDLYEDYLAESPMISTNVDTLIVIKAKEDTVEEVMDILLDYREANVSNTMQYPMNLGKIQASRVERIGNYVCFVQLGGDTDMDAEEEEVITACQEVNELVIEVIGKKLEH